MTPATIIMIVLICLGCVLAIAGVAVLGHYAFRLVKAAKKIGITSKDELEDVIRRARALAPRVRELQKKQKVVAERLESLSATTSRLNYLKDEIDRSTGHLSQLKS